MASKQTTNNQEKDIYLVHLAEGKVVSVHAYSLKEAVELAKQLDKDFKEQDNA